MTDQRIRVQLGLDATGVEAGAKKAEAALQRVGKAGTASAGQIAAATRQLPAQFTDIATQLAGGQNPFLVLLQQGGQIKDSFGGVGNAVRGIASAINPVTLAVGGLAAVVGTLAFGAFAGAKEAAQLRDSITLTGNAAGVTADSVTKLSESLAANSQQTVGASRDIVKELISSGRTSAAVLDSQAIAIARIADLSGRSAKEVAASFAGQLEAPARFAAKLNDVYNFLTIAQFRRIQALEKEGKAVEAVNLTNDTLRQSLEAQRSQVGTLETVWDSFAKAISRAKQALLDIGKPDTTSGLIATQNTRLAELQKRLEETPAAALKRTPEGIRSVRAEIEREIQTTQRRIFELQRRADIEQTNAAARSADAAGVRAGIAGELGKPGAKGGKAPELSAIQTAREQYRADFLRSEKDADAQIARLEQERARDAERAAAEQSRQDQQRQQNQQRILTSLVDANAQASAAIIEDERARGLALIDLDRRVGERRVRDAGFTGAKLEEALGLVNSRAQFAQIDLDRRINDSLRNASDATVSSLTDSISTGILEGFRNGRSLADIFLQELKAQFAKTVLAPLIRPVVEAGNAGLQELLLGIARGISGAVNLGGSGQATAGDFFGGYSGSIDGFRASGGPVAAGGTYVVGERGRELLQMGNQSGRVVPNSALGGGVTLSPTVTVHIDARADQAQVAQLVAAGVQRGNQATFEQLRLLGVVGG